MSAGGLSMKPDWDGPAQAWNEAAVTLAPKQSESRIALERDRVTDLSSTTILPDPVDVTGI
jgi:hypothetical protein